MFGLPFKSVRDCEMIGDVLKDKIERQTPVSVVTSSMVLVRGLLTRGDYLTLLSPRQAAVEIDQGLMRPLDLPLPDSARQIGLTTRSDWMPTPTQARFLDLVRAAARQ